MSKPVSTVQSMLNATIGAGKATVKKVGIAEIERFIKSQPEIVGPVLINTVRGNAEVGASNGVVLFTAQYDIGNGPVSRDLVLRHAPGSETRLFFDYDLARQFKVQRALQGSGVPVPAPLWLDAEGEHLGIPGYIMELVSGEGSNPSAFTVGPLARATAADRQTMLESFMDAVAGIHRVDCAAVGLDDFVMKAPGDGAMQKCVNWYWQTWEWIDLPSYARLVPVHQWLLDNAPSDGVTLTHGDSALHNYMFKGHKVSAVLDWEMSCLGRPEADLALQQITNELFAAPAGSGALMPPTQNEWLALYEKAGGRKIENFDYFRKFAIYVAIVAIMGIQRNLSEEGRAAQRPFTDRCWAMLEA